MHRSVAAFLLFVAATCGGCATYTEIGWPGRTSDRAAEFAADVDLRIGQQVKITTAADRVFSGSLVGWDSLTVIIKSSELTAAPQAIPAAEISRFEVYSPAPWRTLRNAAFVLAGTAATCVLIDELSNQHVFSPDSKLTKGQ